ncbi:MAG: hypothetical protein OEW67_12410, partial [Cyclobacteriaceae bacterium]|nr:hypothetical protein [Cyclobacteriaceae bacterium]
MRRKLTLYQKIVARWNNYILAGVIGLLVGGVMCVKYVSITDMYNENQLKQATARLDGYIETANEV